MRAPNLKEVTKRLLSPVEAGWRLLSAYNLRSAFIAGIALSVVALLFGPSLYEWALSRTTQQWMSILYPTLTASSFVAGMLMLAYWYYVRRVTLVLANAFVFFCESSALFVLTVSTGAHPIFDIEELRYWVVWARFAMLFGFGLMNAICVLLLADHIRSRRKIVDFRAVVDVENLR